MKNLYSKMPNGYQESIQKRLNAARYFSKNMSLGTGVKEENIANLKHKIETMDAIIIGSEARLFTSAGLTYSGERFERYFFDFANKYDIHDIYSGGFYDFPDVETKWAWWARHIYYNRYIEPPKPVYKDLLALVKGKDYFSITTNVDHQFQRSGFDKKRLLYTQGDYGLFQTLDGRNGKTYDNEEWVMKAMEAQGFTKDEDGVFQVPESKNIVMKIPSELIPKCLDDASDVTMNLRVDDSFVEDEGWHRASAAYSGFLQRFKNLNVLYLELGVGVNTPIIVKYPFWHMTMTNNNSIYACINCGEAFCPLEIEDRSICINSDIGEVFAQMNEGI